MSISKEQGKFRARINNHGRRISLGVFDTELKAKRAIAKYRKDHDLSEIWSDRIGLDGFEDIPVSKDRIIGTSSSSFADKMGAKLTKGREWLRKQLDK